MKTYSELITELAGRKPAGEKVFDKKIKRIKVEVYKEKNQFIAYVDGDRLDAFKSLRDAQRSAETVVKELT
jgi:hypothetical protein